MKGLTLLKTASLAMLACVGCGPSASDSSSLFGSGSTSSALQVAQGVWSDALAATTADEDEGCFHASYPSTVWEKVDCTDAPGGARPYTVAGSNNDYVAESSGGLITRSVGTFAKIKSLTAENDGATNEYSIQLNSDFMTGTKACNGVSGCTSWAQFVYDSTGAGAFIQNWLINFGESCPSGWGSYGSDCYTNGPSVSVPALPITDLATMKMSGSATSKKDSLVFTAAGEAYRTSQPDSMVDLSTAWRGSDFDVIGDDDGNEATFNAGTSITVKLAITDGSKTAPTCVAKPTTGESNNLNLGKCTATSAATPYIEYTESL